jgi:Uma2 family endonuclease
MPNRAIKTTMNAPLRKAWTQDEFFSWAERQETRYEFDGFQPVAMTGGTGGHATISGNVFFALRTRLRNSGCKPLGSDAGVEIEGSTVRYPDALVTCTKFSPETRKIPGVVAVFEVVSQTSSGRDHVVKVREYARADSIRRYVIIESTVVGLTVRERSTADEPWQVTTLAEGDVLDLPEFGIEIPVAELYEGIDFEELPEG